MSMHDIGATSVTYSNFDKYAKTDNILPEKTTKCHPIYEFLLGTQAHVD